MGLFPLGRGLQAPALGGDGLTGAAVTHQRLYPTRGALWPALHPSVTEREARYLPRFSLPFSSHAHLSPV